MSDDVIIYAADAELLRRMLVRALDREHATAEERAAARLEIVGALDYLLRHRDQQAGAKAREETR